MYLSFFGQKFFMVKVLHIPKFKTFNAHPYYQNCMKCLPYMLTSTVTVMTVQDNFFLNNSSYVDKI